MKKMKAFIGLLLACQVVLMTGCGRDNYVTYSGFTQGTTYAVIVNCPDGNLGGRIDSVLVEMDGTFSMFNPASLVSRINRNETGETTPLFARCFELAQRIHRQTGGYYDITVKPLVDAWGFGPGQEQESPCVECIMEYVGMDKIRIAGGCIVKDDPRVQLDFSSVAKGVTVDCIAAALEGEGAGDYMVEVGGEVRVRGVNAAGNPWRIGIDKPAGDFDHELSGVAVFGGGGGSVATSGNYRNWFVDGSGRRRVHTINPKTGMPSIGDILSVSVAGADCGASDAYSTGLMAAGNVAEAKTILPPDGTEYYIIYSDETGETAVLRSPGFPLAKE